MITFNSVVHWIIGNDGILPVYNKIIKLIIKIIKVDTRKITYASTHLISQLLFTDGSCRVY